MELAVASIYSGKDLFVKEIDGITYYLVPQGKGIMHYNPGSLKHWREINRRFVPDLVHIHGSEYPMGLAYVNANGPENVAVSIQGLESIICGFFTGGLTESQCIKTSSWPDRIFGKGLLHHRRLHRRLGKYEVELLKQVNHFIGRTEWDRANTWAINPDATYHYCGETLRDAFYTNQWKYENCRPHSIFVSQAPYPAKGLHKVMEALPLVMREFPDVHLYVAGPDLIHVPWYMLRSYGKYLRHLLNKYNLSEHVTFLGPLPEKEMCRQFLQANLFISPSMIENSSNSLGEAQLLRMPYLASVCGGTAEICGYNPEVLYRFEETAMLARKIIAVFRAGNQYKVPETDLSIYDAGKNLDTLISIYRTIVSN